MSPGPGGSRLESLRDRLLTAQAQLTREKTFALAVIVIGMPTAGRSEVVNQCLEWLDPKRIKVHALGVPSGEAADMPPMWRYWQTLPARGEIAIYFLGWYEDYLLAALHGPKVLRKAARQQRGQREAERIVARINQLETMLHHDGVRVLKLQLRVDRNIQKQRIATLRADAATRWRVTREDRWLAKHYGRMRKTMDRLIATTVPAAPWHVIDGADPVQRICEAGSLILKALQRGHRPPKEAASTRRPAEKTPPLKLLSQTRGARLDAERYERELEALQGRFALLTRKKAFAKRRVVLAFEGLDAAGKGGAIRRLTTALDARQYTVVPVSAPTPDELARPYLWRFWRNLPQRGRLAIFDRSWYGRVLVERVRGLTPEPDWRRAYDEINAFELQLAESGMIVHKFWLAVGKDEQLQRLQDRRKEPLKRFKVDEEDWENRRHFAAYQRAASDMIRRTSTEYAPWTVIPADNKKYARLEVLRTACEAIERAIAK